MFEYWKKIDSKWEEERYYEERSINLMELRII